MTTFYRKVIEIELLTDEPLPDEMELGQIGYEMTEGHTSGALRVTVDEKVTGQEMAKLLIAQHSDPEFLGLDADGREVD